MAPMNGNKRARQRAQTEDWGDSDAEIASSNLRKDNGVRKRLRLSTADELSDNVSIQSNTLDTSEDEEQAMINGINGAGDDYDPEIGDDEAERLLQQEFQRPGREDNHAADNAIIEEVVCTNFMCHEHLRIPLGPLINFIIGHNGSGKSAVLTALTLCLGGKATATNRGQNLKSFIKEGKDSAKLSVKIKNQGDSAYKPDLFGSSIIVERHFSRAGASGFNIRNANGKSISTRKADLEDILDFFALQLDNPMNVLTQDMARQFLNHSTPLDKYKFFYKGTHLEQLDSDYRILEETNDSNEAQLKILAEVKKEAKQTWEAADKKAERAKQHRNVTETYNKYSRQMAWAQVGEEEQNLVQIDEQLREAEAKVHRRTTEAEATGVVLDEASQVVEQAQASIQQIQEELVPKKEEKDRIGQEFKDAFKELQDLHFQQRGIRGDMKTAQNAITRINAELEKEREKLRAADNGQHAQKMEEIELAKAELENIREELISHSSQSAPLDRALQDAHEAANASNGPVEEKTREVRSSENRISQLSGGRANWMQTFPPNLGNLLKAIANETRWREQPVGPLGRHVALLKPEWSSVLEKSAGAILNAFVVTSMQDLKILNALVKRERYNAAVFKGNSTPMDTSRNEPGEHLLTWMRALKIDNDLVRNTLIINASIEQTVLIANRTEAVDWMKRERPPGARQIPRVQRVFTLNDDGSPGGNVLKFSSAGNEDFGGIQAWTGGARMQTDVEAQLASARHHLARSKQELQTAETDRRTAQISRKNAEQALVRHKRDAKALQLQLQRQESEVEKLESELEAETPQTGTIDELQIQLEAEQDLERMHSSTYEESVIEKDKLNAANRLLKDQCDELDLHIEEIENKVKKAENRVIKLEQKRHQALLNKNEAYEIIKDAQREQAELQEERDEQERVIENYSRQASEVSARVAIDQGETTETLERRLSDLRKIIERHQAEFGADPNDLVVKALELKVVYEEKCAAYENQHNLIQALKLSLHNRKLRWAKFRVYVTIRARQQFGFYLMARQFRGDLEIRHKDRELDIEVQPDNTRKSDKGRQTKTLSGGEKSFSTICLLLALWDAMGSPIRCLDEFDVFMDSVNRDISMKMIIDAARSATSRQFVLITPQAMGNVNMSHDVKILKMTDPERGQTALPFGRT